MPDNVDWASLDWRLQDVELAGLVGRSTERVRQKRRALGKSDPPNKRGRMTTKRNMRALAESLDFVSTVPERTAGPILGLTRAELTKGLRRLGFRKPLIQPRKFPVEHVNWDLANRDIAAVWGVHEAGVGNVRSLRKFGRARWDGRHPNLSGCREYIEAIEREKQTAAAWRLGCSAIEHAASKVRTA